MAQKESAEFDHSEINEWIFQHSEEIGVIILKEIQQRMPDSTYGKMTIEELLAFGEKANLQLNVLPNFPDLSWPEFTLSHPYKIFDLDSGINIMEAIHSILITIEAASKNYSTKFSSN